MAEVRAKRKRTRYVYLVVLIESFLHPNTVAAAFSSESAANLFIKEKYPNSHADVEKVPLDI